MEEIVVVGLGNPGRKYEGTRHNIGFEVVRKLAERLGADWFEDKRMHAYVAKVKTLGASWHLICPQTFMNLSGRSLASYLSFYRMTKEQVIVVSDDVNILFGEIRIRSEGSSGGHNGLKDIERVVGRQYARLRIGVGGLQNNEKPQMALEDYVLAHFTAEEYVGLPSIIERAVGSLIRLPVDDLETIIHAAHHKAKEKSKEKNIKQNPLEGQEKGNDPNKK